MSGDHPRRYEDDNTNAQADQLYDQGLAFEHEGRLEEAADAYRRAVELAPADISAWWNLGLVSKRLRRWDECLGCNERVVALEPVGEAAWMGEGARWNLGIAATALRNWTTARAAWRGYSIDIPAGDGPLEMELGLVCVRLNPDADAEVVWCERIDPARAIIRNIPLPESGHRWGDYVLHDGEQRGERVVGGQAFAVFDELERWQASEVPTATVQLSAPSPEDARALVELFEENGLGAEDWTGSVELLCRACSEGRPHEHGAPDAADWRPERLFGLAAPRGVAEALLERWAGRSPGCRYASLEMAEQGRARSIRTRPAGGADG